MPPSFHRSFAEECRYFSGNSCLWLLGSMHLWPPGYDPRHAREDLPMIGVVFETSGLASFQSDYHGQFILEVRDRRWEVYPARMIKDHPDLQRIGWNTPWLDFQGRGLWTLLESLRDTLLINGWIDMEYHEEGGKFWRPRSFSIF